MREDLAPMHEAVRVALTRRPDAAAAVVLPGANEMLFADPARFGGAATDGAVIDHGNMVPTPYEGVDDARNESYGCLLACPDFRCSLRPGGVKSRRHIHTERHKPVSGQTSCASSPRGGDERRRFIKTQELDAQYQLELPIAASPRDPPVAAVDITTTLVSVMAPSEEAVRQLPLSSDGPRVTKIARRYRFEWTGRHWALSNASLRLEIKAPDMSSLPMKDKKVDPSDARKGFDAGATCVQTIESTYWQQR